MKNDITLSVILPIRNDKPDIIRSCLLSLENQTFKKFELIIIDDSNKEESIQAIDNSTIKNLKVIREKRNRNGLSSALNRGIEIACGAFIARVDADDIQQNTRFEKQIQFLSENADIDVVGCNTFIIDENESILGEKKFPATDAGIKQKMSISNPLSHTTLMFKKQFFEIAGGYDENLKRAEDYALWLKARDTEKLYFHNLQENLVSYRVSNIQKRDNLNWSINLKLKLKYFKLKYFFSGITGITLILSFLILPDFVKSRIYKKYTTW